MIIQQKRIRSLKGKLGSLRSGSIIVIGARLVPDLLEKLRAIGFRDGANVGDSVLPTSIGPVTHFNSHGGAIIHRDQPKETAYRTREWHWKQFNGRYDTKDVSDFVEVSYKRFPRTPVPPPSIELTITMTADGQRILVAPPLSFNGDNDVQLIHAINLMLEAMGFCEVFTRNLDSVIQAPIRRLNWKLLPSGHRSWAELRPDVIDVVKRAPGGNRPVIEHRLESINQYGPDFVAIGLAGFAGYVVFGFTPRNMFVFESIYSRNATYVFGDQWEGLSKMTKMQILDNRAHLDRIIHRDGWDERIKTLLSPGPGKPR